MAPRLGPLRASVKPRSPTKAPCLCCLASFRLRLNSHEADFDEQPDYGLKRGNHRLGITWTELLSKEPTPMKGRQAGDQRFIPLHMRAWWLSQKGAEQKKAPFDHLPDASYVGGRTCDAMRSSRWTR